MLHDDELSIIVSFLQPKFGLVPWIKLNQLNGLYLGKNPSPSAIKIILQKAPSLLDWDQLSKNPDPVATTLLEKNPDKINWDELSKNPSEWAAQILFLNPSRINWNNLSKNPSNGAIQLLEQNIDKIEWDNLVQNPSAISLIEAHPHELENRFHLLAKNTNLRAIQMVADYFYNDWIKFVGVRDSLYKNPAAMGIIYDLLKRDALQWIDINFDAMNANPGAVAFIIALHRNPNTRHGIVPDQLARNTSPEALQILEEDLSDHEPPYFLYELCGNPSPKAIEIVSRYSRYLDSTCWRLLSQNPAIFHLGDEAYEMAQALFDL